MAKDESVDACVCERESKRGEIIKGGMCRLSPQPLGDSLLSLSTSMTSIESALHAPHQKNKKRRNPQSSLFCCVVTMTTRAQLSGLQYGISPPRFGGLERKEKGGGPFIVNVYFQDIPDLNSVEKPCKPTLESLAYNFYDTANASL